MLSNSAGDIIGYPPNEYLDTLLTENWQRFVVNFHHNKNDEDNFIDVGPISVSGDIFEFAHPRLT